ncbi:uncharacterized protein M6B38_203550 [Iris pallida]|uniref:Uncharacterized protein n=1 Tax=Iris pallida TaxID=29817 RepID=A0AAX6E711_IRIPA|nr:uncharacterized protein M6B38_203550 [Iris pallida]
MAVLHEVDRWENAFGSGSARHTRSSVVWHWCLVPMIDRGCGRSA